MFDEIAPRYDLLNHVLSMNIDRLWWRRTARTFAHVLGRSDASVLDLCAGTGDMAVALRAISMQQERGPESVAIYALDFSHRMLQHGLDGEHRCLDEAYASAIAVWGPNRQSRYRRASRRQPDSLVVTGKAKGKDAEWTFAVDPKTKIRKNNKDVTAADLVAGDSVQVRYHAEGGKNVAGMLGETEENWHDSVRKTLALQPDSVTIYQMELPFNTTISRDLLKGEGRFTQAVANWATKRRWVQEAFEALEEAG